MSAEEWQQPATAVTSDEEEKSEGSENARGSGANSSAEESDAEDWDDELGDIDDLSDPESDLEDSLPVATTDAVPGKQEYLDSCARLRIIPVSAFIKSMGQNKVSLRHYLLGAQGARAVSDALALNNTIASLDLSNTWLGVEGAQCVAKSLEDNVTMIYLDVSDNRLGLHGGLAMSELLKSNDTLQDMCLAGNKLCDRVADAMAAALRKNEALTRLDVSHNELQDRGAQRIGEMLLSNTCLKDVDLSWNRITGKGGVALAEMIENNKSLHVLDLGWNSVGDECGKHLEVALRENDQLRHLNLANNRLSSESAEAISNGIRDNKGLVSFVIDNNPFGAKGCDMIMDALKDNPAIINVGLNNVEPEANFADLEPMGANEKMPQPPPKNPADEQASAPVSPRTLLSPRQTWARNPVEMKLPSASKPTGYYKLNLSKPWERLAAERLAAVKPQPGIKALATLSPNLAPGKDGVPFNLEKNAQSMPDTGILQVKFQMMKHGPRQTVVYKLKLDNANQLKIAQKLREKASLMMHDEFGLVELDGRPFAIPLSEDSKWQWPAAGTIMISFITPDLDYAIPLRLNLTDVLDFSLADFLLKKVKVDETHNWVDPKLDDDAFTVASDSLVTEEKDRDTGRPLPTGQFLVFKHSISHVDHKTTQHFLLNLKQEDDRKKAMELSDRSLRTPGINIVDVTLDGKPYVIERVPPYAPDTKKATDPPAGSWIVPEKGKLEFDEVHLVHETGTPASHSAVLRVEEALQDTKRGDDDAKWKILSKALREPETSCLGADQAKKLIETFDEPARREEVLKMLLPKIVAIDLYEAMRGCV